MKFCILFICLVLNLNAFAQEYLNLENEVPSNWSATNDGLSLSSKRYKLGSEAVEWEWSPSSQVLINNPSGLAGACKTYKGGMMLWIYNEEAKDADLLFEYLTATGEVQYYFTYHLNFIGWRACWIRFDEDMMGKKQDSNLSSMHITAPPTANGGVLYFDRMKFPANRVNDRVTPDAQLPYINPEMNANHWAALWHWHNTYEYEQDLPASMSDEEKQSAAEIRKRITNNIKGKTPSNARLSAILTQYDALKIKRNGDYITGASFVSDDEFLEKNGDSRLKDLDALVYDIAKVWYNSKQSGYDQMFINIFDWLHDQGLTVGSGMGTNHHYGYSFRGFPKAIWLMQDVLKGANKFNQVFDMIQYWTGVPEVRHMPEAENFQGIVDSWNTILSGRLMAILLRDDSPELARDLNAYKEWMSAVMRPSLGTVGGFKPDGAGFHHGMIYGGYMNGGYSGLGEIMLYLGNTHFNVPEDALFNFKKALTVHSWYANKHSIINGVSGRHPLNASISNGSITAMAHLAKAFPTVDRELAAEYMRLIGSKTTLYKEFMAMGIAPAASPIGNMSINYGALNLHRRENWLVATKGFNNIVTGTEIYSSNNRYGRYQGYGTVQVLSSGNPISASESGFVLEGWDWNRFPGATTIHLPYELLDYKGSNINERSAKSKFAGACTLGDNGVFGMLLDENDHANYTDDFVARKSVFAFDNRIICLGSNISNSNSQYATETTLFQVHMSNVNSGLYINGEENNQFPMVKSVKALEPITILDSKGTGYYLPSGDIQIHKSLQESRNNKNRSANIGNFGTAWINHGISPVDVDYEYAMLINTTVIELQNFKASMQAANRPYRVFRKDKIAHIVKDEASKTTAYVLFEANNSISTQHIKSTDHPCLVMVKEHDKQNVLLTLVDPDINMDAPTRLTNIAEVKERKIQLTLKGIYRLKESNNNCTFITNGDNTTILEFICIHGLSVGVELIRDVTNAIETSNHKQGTVMSCYPNPVNNVLFLKNEAPIGCIQIFDCEGRLHMAINNPKNPINVDNLLPGIYFLHVEFMGKEQGVIRFIKR